MTMSRKLWTNKDNSSSALNEKTAVVDGSSPASSNKRMRRFWDRVQRLGQTPRRDQPVVLLLQHQGEGFTLSITKKSSSAARDPTTTTSNSNKTECFLLHHLFQNVKTRQEAIQVECHVTAEYPNRFDFHYSMAPQQQHAENHHFAGTSWWSSSSRTVLLESDYFDDGYYNNGDVIARRRRDACARWEEEEEMLLDRVIRSGFWGVK